MIDVYALASCLLVSVYLWIYWFVACYYNVLWMCSVVLCKGYHVPVSVCTGVLVRFGWSRVISECRLEQVRTSAPEDECNNIRNMLSNKKTLIK